jgi:hypothetical protein
MMAFEIILMDNMEQHTLYSPKRAYREHLFIGQQNKNYDKKN